MQFLAFSGDFSFSSFIFTSKPWTLLLFRPGNALFSREAFPEKFLT